MLYWLTVFSDCGDFFNLFRYITFRAGGAFFTALVFGFLHLFVPGSSLYNFERLHIFLFNLLFYFIILLVIKLLGVELVLQEKKQGGGRKVINKHILK